MKEKKGKDGGEGGVRNVNNEEYTRTCTVHNFIVDNSVTSSCQHYA